MIYYNHKIVVTKNYLPKKQIKKIKKQKKYRDLSPTVYPLKNNQTWQ